MILIPCGALLALITAWLLFRWMKGQDQGNDTMKDIAAAVRSGAFAYLRRQSKLVAMVFIIVAILLLILAAIDVVHLLTVPAFLIGGFWAGLAGFIGMNTATLASGRTAAAAQKSLPQGLSVAFRSGAVMGLSVVGLALFDLGIWYLILDNFVFTAENIQNGLEMGPFTIVTAAGEIADADLLDQARLGQLTTCLVTFGLGASTQALFARIGGGIFTKAADVGADLVGKVEAGIPEDDPRNPATIADNVGDNVGDVAGMGADLYESYYGSLIATASLGAAVSIPLAASSLSTTDLVTAPLWIAAIGIVSSLLSLFFVRCNEQAKQSTLLMRLLIGTSLAGVGVIIGGGILWSLGMISGGMLGAVIVGLATGILIGQATEYYTSSERKPALGISDQAKMGVGPAIIDGLAVGLVSTCWPVLFIAAGMVGAFACTGGFVDEPSALVSGLYGVSLAAVGMLATLGITLATDAYGPIADNAGGNAEMSSLDPIVRERTDILDTLGNTTAATGKGFAIGSAALTALAMIASFMIMVAAWIRRSDSPMLVNHTLFTPDPATAQVGSDAIAVVDSRLVGLMDVVQAYDISLVNPLVIAGLFIGSMSAFVFSAWTMRAVGRAAGVMVDEVRRQFKSIAGIMQFKPGDKSPENEKRRPDYESCVNIATQSAQREMLLPALFGIVVPILTGLLLGVPGVLGLLAGSLASGFCLATLLNNAGGAWDNAKKAVEAGRNGGKHMTNEAGQWVNEQGDVVATAEEAVSPVHAACVIGDTVGDPCKDTAGPALNILIKLMAIVSVVFSGVTVYFSWLS